MATFDQLGDAAGSISNRLRRTASIVPEGTPAKVKKTQVRFGYRDNYPSEETVLKAADHALPELPFAESHKRTQQADAIVGRAALEGRPLAPDEQAIVDAAPMGYPDFKIGRGQGRAKVMTGRAAQAMSDSRPYPARWLDADQPDIGLGPKAQKAMAAEMEGVTESGSVNQTLRDMYKAYYNPAPGSSYDLPNEYLGLSEDELLRRAEISGGQNIVDTRTIPERIEQGTYGRDYGSQEPIYKDISSGTIEDRAFATGNPMDEYLASVISPGLSYDERTIAYGQMVEDFNRRNAGQSTRLVLPENAYVPSWGKTRNVPLEDGTGTYELPNVIIPRSAERTVIDNLGPSDLSRRLRQSAQMQQIYNSPTERVAVTRGRGTGALAFNDGQVVVVPETNIGGSLVQQPLSYSRGVEELRNAQVANPVQVDFRQASDQGRRLADSTGRVRGQQLDQQIMEANAAATGADTTNFVIKDVNPDEYYLYGSQADTQGLLPDEVAGVSRTYGYQPSESLVNVGFSSKQVKPVQLKAGRVGLGVDITAQDPYSRTAVTRSLPGREDLLDVLTGKSALGRTEAPVRAYRVDPQTADFEAIAQAPFTTPRTPDLRTEIVHVRNDRYIPVDPITPIDLELPGVRYAEASGLQPDITPEIAIAEDQRAAARLRAIAQREQTAVDKYNAAPREGLSPNMQRRADNAYDAMVQSDILDSSAANMENAMRIANEQTAPQGNVILTQISNQGPGQSIFIRGQEMPFEEALELMKLYTRGGATEQVLRLPVVPTVAPEQTQLSKRLRLAQQVGTPESASIMSDPAVGLYKQIAKADPDVQVNELRRGVQYTMVPKGETGQAYDIRLDNPGVPVIDPNTGQRMKWQGQPIETFNPLDQANPSGPEFAVRARATRPQIKQETYQQTADAINEGYVLRGTGDPYDRVLVSGDDLAEMRGGLSRQEMRQAQQHNLAREMSGLAPLDPVEMTNILKRHNLNMQDRTVNLIKNPPAQGGVFMWGDDDFGYGSSMAARFPSSGPPIEVQSGGMLDAFMTQPLEPRMMHPRIRQVDPSAIQAQGPLVYRPAPQVPSQVQPARIEGRADLDWQRSPSFRFPQNVWQGSGR